MAKAESLTRSSGFIVPFRRGQSLFEKRSQWLALKDRRVEMTNGSMAALGSEGGNMVIVIEAFLCSARRECAQWNGSNKARPG